MVDYSRFNKLCEDLSDSDDEKTMLPRVTKLSKPSTVTIGAAAAANKINRPIAKPTDWNKWVDDEEEEEEEENPPLKMTFIEDEFIPKKPLLPSFQPITIATSYTRNGADNGVFLWSQTSTEVLVRFRNFPLETKAKQISVQLKDKILTVSCPVHQFMFQAELAYDVVKMDDEDELWEITDFEDKKRCVLIRFTKKSPVPNVYVWWRRVFVNWDGEIEVDVTTIKDRKTQLDPNVWQAAHDQFRQQNKSVTI